MPINLAKVNISLAQFQEISSGKYNAGEVKLSGETSLAKINNHIHFTGRNVETVSHEETIAIKEALVRALASNGVPAEAVNAVRRELGLAPDGVVDRTLSERSVKPLSRQQIRDILDRNAAAINAAKGDGTIRTETEMHAKRSASRNDSIHDKRVATNAALDDSRATLASKAISLAQTVIAGDVDFRSRDERQELLRTALDQKASILERSGGTPSTEPDGSISVRTSGGPSVELKLGMSEADYLGKLDDMILRLRGARVPSDRDIAAREEFKAHGDGRERNILLAKLALSPERYGARARAMVVMVMQERGIEDFETLSLVNSIGDESAISLLRTLLKDTSGCMGEDFRQSETIQSFVALARDQSESVPPSAQTFIPALSPDELAAVNEQIAREAGQGQEADPRTEELGGPRTDEVDTQVDEIDTQVDEIDTRASEIDTRASEVDTRAALREAEHDFLDGIGAARASYLGYHQSEMPMLARAFSFCRVAGMSERDSIAAVTDPLSKPMRLFGYGGRFTSDVEGFKQGLKLMDDFRPWFDQLCTDLDHYKSHTPTLANASTMSISHGSVNVLERFLFEEIAVNEEIPLSAANLEDVFGMVANPAMRFAGRLCAQRLAISISHVPPERRGLLFAVMDAVDPLLAKGPGSAHLYDSTLALLVARTMMNYDDVAALRESGNLDRSHVLKMLLPEFPAATGMTNSEFIEAYNDYMMALKEEEGLDEFAPGGPWVNGSLNETLINVLTRLQTGSGAPLDTVLSAIKAGRSVPTLPFVTSFKMPDDFFMERITSPAQGECEAMFNFLRYPQMPTRRVNGEGVISAKDMRFVFNFPDGQLASAMDSAHRKEAENAIAGKIEELCGPVHQAQLAGVYRALSQNGRVQMVDAFRSQGILTDEYCPLAHTLTRDEETGAVTIRYSQPEGFPFSFSWETTVALDGTATSTPLVIE